MIPQAAARGLLISGALAFLAGCGSDGEGVDEAGDAGTDATGAVIESEATSVDGVTVRYDARGSGEPTLVLVHGWMNDRGIWGEHRTTLAQTHRVVALDLGGHGASGTDRSDWTIDAFGEDVVAVVDQLDLDRLVLVGFSMGGAVALEAAELLGGRVSGIVFVDTFHDPEARMTEDAAEQMIATFRANRGDTTFLRAFAYSPDAPSFTVDTLAGVGHAGILHRRVEDFDARLRAIVQRFETDGGGTPLAASAFAR